MKRSFVIKGVGATLSAIATATGVGLDVVGMIRLPVDWWPFLTFFVFCGLVVWMIYGLYRENSRLVNDRPSVYVEPMREGETFYLKVSNNGEKGVFKAQIELESEDDPAVWRLKNYIGYWKNANSGESEILKGHNDWIKIAELMGHASSASVYLKVSYYEGKFNRENYISSSSHWIGATIRSGDGETKLMSKHEYKLRVTISANPSLREGIYQEKFRLNVDRLEVDTDFR